MAQRGRKSKRHHALIGIQNELAGIQKRLDALSQEGVDEDQITPLLTRLSTAAEALIAKGAGAITSADVTTIVNALTDVATKLETAAAA
jgi:ribosomal 50S subunit-associated protein YjgA (DUF615 family)